MNNRKFEKQVKRNLLAKDYESKGNIKEAIRLYEKNITELFLGDTPYDRLSVIYGRENMLYEEIRVLESAVHVFEHADKDVRMDKDLKLKKYKDRLECVKHAIDEGQPVIEKPRKRLFTKGRGVLLAIVLAMTIIPVWKHYSQEYFYYRMSIVQLENKEYINAYESFKSLSPLFLKRKDYMKQAINGQVNQSNILYSKGDVGEALYCLKSIPIDAYIFLNEDIKPKIDKLSKEDDEISRVAFEKKKAYHLTRKPYKGMSVAFIDYTLWGKASLFNTHEYRLNNAGRPEKHVIESYRFQYGHFASVQDGIVEYVE